MKWFKKKQKKSQANEYIGFFFEKEGIAIETEDLLLFPKRETIFTSLSKIHKQVFFPLCSINMALIEPDWDFYGHFVYVFREKEESLHSSKYHTKYCHSNSLGFDVVAGKYDLQAKVEMLALLSRSILRYNHGRHTTGMLMSIWALSMLIAFNFGQGYGYAISFIPFGAPILLINMSWSQFEGVVWYETTSQSIAIWAIIFTV